MKACFIPLILIFLIAGCADDVESVAPPATALPDSANKAKQFFPVLDYLRGEVRNVDSFATALKTYTTVNGKTDSGFISVEQFNAVMQEYLPAELSKENFEKYYMETSFFDETTQTSTFTYSTKNDELDFHRIDVIVKGSDTYDKVSSVYMEKFTGNDDSSVVKKMLLRAGNSVVVNSEVSLKNSKPVMKQEKFAWNWE